MGPYELAALEMALEYRRGAELKDLGFNILSSQIYPGDKPIHVSLFSLRN